MSGYRLGKMYGTQGNTIMMPEELSAAEVAANNDAAIKEILANDAALENRERASENPSKISIRGKAARMLDVPISTLVEMQDTGELTEMGLSLLVNSGQSMVDYLVKEGVSNTFEVYRALGEWADKNKKILPMNKSFLLKTVGKKALLEMDN